MEVSDSELDSASLQDHRGARLTPSAGVGLVVHGLGAGGG